jgi:hypothetical protein
MRIIPFFILFILTVSCHKEKAIETNLCAEGSTIDNISWIANIKRAMGSCSVCERSIVRATYRQQVVFFETITAADCDYANTPTLYSCDGKVVRTFTLSATDQQEFIDDVKRDAIVYVCKN